jgi:hypothetical protein
VCPPPPPKAGGYTLAGRRGGGGGSIFWKTPDIGMSSYSIISLLGKLKTSEVPGKILACIKYELKSGFTGFTFGNRSKDDGKLEVYLSPPLLLLVATEH